MADALLHGRCRHAMVPELCVICGPPPPKPKGKRGDASRFSHPGFQDLTGQTLAGCTVLQRVANASGNACWLVRAFCGHRVVVQGIALRRFDREGRKYRCKECRPKRPGTVRRRG